MLQGKIGYFLIRYSESEFGLGNYAVTVNHGKTTEKKSRSKKLTSKKQKGKSGKDNIQHYATKHYPETNGFIFDDKVYYSMKDFILDHQKILVHPLPRFVVSSKKKSL